METNALISTTSPQRHCFHTDDSFFVLNGFQDVFFTIALSVCGLGLFLSLATCLIYLRKEVKQSKDIYACALSACDMLCNMSGVMYTLASLSDWGYTQTVCWVNIYMWRATPSMSWLLILSIAISRYLAVIKYNYFKKHFNKRKVYFNLFFVFVASLLLSIPFPFSCYQIGCTTKKSLKGATRPQQGDYVFQFSSDTDPKDGDIHKVEYQTIYRIGLVSIVSIALVFLYGRIIYELRARKQYRNQIQAQLNRMSSTNERMANGDHETIIEHLNNQLENLTSFFTGATGYVRNHLQMTFGFSEDSDQRTEVMFINVAVLFAICNLPYSIVETIDVMRVDKNPNPKATSSLLLLFVVGFNVNPFIFYISNPWFRSELNSICCSFCRCPIRGRRTSKDTQKTSPSGSANDKSEPDSDVEEVVQSEIIETESENLSQESPANP